jgi:hypothetical protein
VSDDVTDTYPGSRCTRATAKALCVVIPVLGGEFWIPKRVVHADSEVHDAGHVGKLVVAGWFGLRLLEERDSRRRSA